MDTPFDASSLPCQAWDGYVGWFSSGDTTDNIDVLEAVLDTDNAIPQPQLFFGPQIAWQQPQLSPPQTNEFYPFEVTGDPGLLQWELPAITAASHCISSASQAYHIIEGTDSSSAVTKSAYVAGYGLGNYNPQAQQLDSNPRHASSVPHHQDETQARSLSNVSISVPILPRTDPPLSDYQGVDGPRRRPPRFAGDEYSATWIRGDKTQREGWCGLCSTWHRLKDSAYWYHMHYSHGISCQTGKAFDHPVRMRPIKGSFGYEVLCGGCNQWLQVSRAERWKTPYYRHAYRCQSRLKGSSISPRRTPSKKKK